jgi:hypothetical protein
MKTMSFKRTLKQAREKSAAKDLGNAIALWEKVVRLNPVTGEYWYQLADAQGATRVVTLKADSEIPSRKLWDGLPPNWKHFAQTLNAPLPLYLKKQYLAKTTPSSCRTAS